ncbi:hypothetical protein [Mycolicibacterium xanthum]|uniref:hypothetical protein n=1 Tax=Mycolicibacterium xanthum TaxID=2796469 RepID=UPI002105B2CC
MGTLSVDGRGRTVWTDNRTGAVSRATAAGVALASAALLAACATTIGGTPTCPGCGTNAEPSFPTPRSSAPTAAPPSTLEPQPTPPSPGTVLPAQNGYVFIETKSGKTRCQLDEQEVGCESSFVNAPEIDGTPANGVRLSADGDISWVLGNLGAIPTVTLDYQTYSAVGWTIDADQNGTRFTNDRTGHGMAISVEGVEGF